MAASKTRALPGRAVTAVIAGKLLGKASRRLGRGGGTALPGVIAERIDPRLTMRLAGQIGAGRALVTGTNGKTTTSRMLAGIAEAAGTRPIHNRSGSNLMRGIGATLIDAAAFGGRIPGAPGRAGIFEVDEATLPAAVRELRPAVVVFTNLFRDQLDRYGEVDSILSLWQRGLRLLPADATLVLNADDPSVSNLAADWPGTVSYYGVDDAAGAAGDHPASRAEHAADARWCHACGAEYVYAPLYFGHLGLWRCPGCGRERPTPQISVTELRRAGDGRLCLTVAYPGGNCTLELPLEGLYNAYNAAAAFAGALALGFAADAAVGGLTRFDAAFGRQEKIDLQGRDVRVLLCKNPAGMNQALGTVLSAPRPLYLLVALNDGVQDGRDISWIWDVDFERLTGQVARITVTGTRAADLALRLKYAALGDAVALEQGPEQALARALQSTPAGARLSVLPTYTAMMRLRALIAAQGGRGAFWEQ